MTFFFGDVVVVSRFLGVAGAGPSKGTGKYVLQNEYTRIICTRFLLDLTGESR